MANRTRSKKRSKKMYNQRGGAFTHEQRESFGQEIPQEAIDAWSDSDTDYDFFVQAIQQFNEAIEQSTQAINTFRDNYIQNIIEIANKIRQESPMNVNELMIQIVSPPGSPNSVASSRMKEGGKRRKTRKMRGGARFGTGVGANNSDPNYSIFNTRALSLFPYKPN
jgi:hypothetical protein